MNKAKRKKCRNLCIMCKVLLCKCKNKKELKNKLYCVPILSFENWYKHCRDRWNRVTETTHWKEEEHNNKRKKNDKSERWTKIKEKKTHKLIMCILNWKYKRCWLKDIERFGLRVKNRYNIVTVYAYAVFRQFLYFILSNSYDQAKLIPFSFHKNRAFSLVNTWK